MGFLDKAKQQASALASKAQEGINQGQEKLSEAQAKRQANALIEELGAWEWAVRQGRDGGEGPAQIARIETALRDHEAEHGPVDAPSVPSEQTAETPPPTAAGAPPEATQAPPAGGAAPPTGAAAPPPPSAAPVAPAPPSPAPDVPAGGFTLD